MSSITDIAAEIAELANDHDLEVAVAESLTGGSISAALAAAPAAADWYAGGVTSYEARIKYEVLGVPDGQPVVTEETARDMVRGIAELMNVDTAVAVTGAGGPDPEEGQPPGTTWIAVSIRGSVITELNEFTGEPGEIVEQTKHRAIELLRDGMRRLTAAGSA